MRTLVVRGSPQKLFDLVDPDSQSEAEFEFIVVRALSSLYPDHRCRVFTGSFLHEGQVSRPDLMLVAPDFSHWFVLEVELISHSLHGHVLPQVRAVRYGEPQEDCITILARELAITEQSARTLLLHVPRTVAVIANSLDRDWATALGGVPVQYAAVSVFRSGEAEEALEVQGEIEPIERSLGFGTIRQRIGPFDFPARSNSLMDVFRSATLRVEWAPGLCDAMGSMLGSPRKSVFRQFLTVCMSSS